MARKISDMQRIINFGLDASAEGLQSAIEALQTIRANRYPKQTKTARKPRSDKGSRRVETPPAAESAAAASE